MKYQRKTKEIVDVLKAGPDTFVETILDFVCDCTICGIQISAVMCSKESEENYFYTFMTKIGSGIAYYKKGQYIIRNADNEIEIYNKDEFVENFTTTWEYE